MKRILRLVAVAFGLAVIVVVVLALFLARDRALTLIYPGRAPITVSPEAAGLPGAQEVAFTTSDGATLNAWYLPPPNDMGAVVVFAHGLGGNRTSLAGQAAIAVRLSYGALLFDLRNHGDSGGTQTTLGYYEPLDVQAAVAFLGEQPGVNPRQVVLVGESLGGAAVLMAMPQLPDVAGVVIESTFSTVQENIEEGVERLTGLPPFPFAPMLFFFGEWETGVPLSTVRPIDSVAAISPRPVMFMHGDADGLFDVANSERLLAAASEPKQLVVFPGAEHGGLHVQDPARFEEAFTAFLAQAVPLS